VEVVNKNYMNGLIKCLKLPQSLGFVGGRPRSSLYFVGFQGSRLLYLDPHTVQKVPPFQTDLRRVSSSFHCAKLRTMKLDELDPSLALGFYCRDRAEFFHFWSSIEEMQQSSRYPPFRVEAKAPSYDDFLDLDDEEDDDDDAEDHQMMMMKTNNKNKKEKKMMMKKKKKKGQTGGSAEEKDSSPDDFNDNNDNNISQTPKIITGSRILRNSNRNGSEEKKNGLSPGAAPSTSRSTPGAFTANAAIMHGGRTRAAMKNASEKRPQEAEFLVDDGFVIL